MSKHSNWTVLTQGIFKENPVLILMIGLCPTLATSSNANSALGMGFAVLAVLLASNILVSLTRKFVPEEIRIPIFIIIISTFVTIVDYVIHAYAIELYTSLGVFIPLIVVNCIILGRAEAFASKNSLWLSTLDALGMGTGFIVAITTLGAIREVIGNGSVTLMGRELFNMQAAGFKPALLFIMPPGAFMVIGFMIAVVRRFTKKRVEAGSCCTLPEA